MCDWEESEYAEYLLWLEAAEARARARLAPRSAVVEGSVPSAPRTEPIAA
jgi:hypothetical protein